MLHWVAVHRHDTRGGRPLMVDLMAVLVQLGMVEQSTVTTGEGEGRGR